MKTFLLITSLIFSLGSIAQTWSPPGANWKYSYTNGFGTEGYVEIKYVSDTLIGGITASKLEKSRHTYTYWNNQFDNNVFGYELTYEVSGIVYVWFNNNWDTLYNFNASIGDKWSCAKQPNFPFCDQNNFLLVLDTGTTIINNQSLKFLVVQFMADSIIFFQPVDTLIEKIGFKNSYMFPYDYCDAAFDVNEGGGLRCYSDNNFSLYQPNFSEACDFIIGIEENVDNQSLSVFPNPAIEFLTIDGLPNSGYYKYKIADITGKILDEGKVTDQLDVSNLDSGIYFLTLYSDRVSKHLKFIKN